MIGCFILSLIRSSWPIMQYSTHFFQILRIKLHASTILEYDPTPAIHHWNTGKRRPEYKTTRLGSLSTLATDQPPAASGSEEPLEEEEGWAKVDNEESDFEFNMSQSDGESVDLIFSDEE